MFYSQSEQLENNQPLIEAHWEKIEKGFFPTSQGKLFYIVSKPVQSRFTVFLVNGRVESTQKYQELIWEFYQNGITVYSYDHIGQGASPRLLENKQKGHINEFASYADTLHCFVEFARAQTINEPCFILAHSMGGAIALDYLSRYTPDVISGCYLTAPMLGINTAPYHTCFATFIAQVASSIGLKQHYAVGQSGYKTKPFLNNDLTQCEVRYHKFRQLYSVNPHLKLGGVTFGWLYQALKTAKRLQQVSITIPTVIASASHDDIVLPQAYKIFKNKNSQTTLIEWPGKHELLCEIDSIRRPLLAHFYQFCQSITESDLGS